MKDADANPVTLELLADISAAFNSRDPDRIMSYFAEDCTFYMARGTEACGTRVHGKAAVRKVLADRFKVIPDMSWTDHKRWVCGNRAVSQWTVRGKSADGEALEYWGCDLYEFQGDKILNKDTYWKQVSKAG